MKSDISRQTFDSTKHYTQVIMQQGRVQLDTDWNEQQAILRYYGEAQSRDVIGQSGVPQAKNGFQLQFTADKHDLQITHGRIYVDGILCELEHTTSITNQPNYPGAPSAFDLQKLWQTEAEGLRLIYLDVWQRHITAVDDLRLREVALGGPDTTTRLQTIWQVKWLPVPIPDELARLLKKEAEEAKEETEPGTELHKQQEADERKGLEARITRYLHDYVPETWHALVAPPTGKLTVTTYNAENPTASGYRGLQNELYHVELHTVDEHNHPRIVKWARNNASILVRVKARGTTLTVPNSGQGSILNFKPDQFVELVNEVTELTDQRSQLAKITLVDTLTNQITLDSSLGSGTDHEEHIKIRLWDGQLDTIPFNTEIPLEAGIKLQFSEGTYKPGDYWLIPARTSTGEVEWPPYAYPNTHPTPQPRQGTLHHYARLAWIYWRQKQPVHKIYDIRKRFTPLTHTIDAMHVAWINWHNDTLHPRRLWQWKERGPQGEGLRIWLDVAPDARSIKPETFIVTLETNLSGSNSGSFILNGHTEVRDNLIIWHWRKEREGLLAKLFEEREEGLLGLFHHPEHFVRVRVTLKGHLIWANINDRHIYLDGQAFGVPHAEEDGRYRTALSFPSGSGVKASDFESWFHIRE